MAIPNAPSNLAATVISATQVKLAWHDNSSNENGFKIQRSANGTTWSGLATTKANITSYSDLTVATNTKHWYRVRSFNSVGSSSWSNIATVTPASGIAARYPGDINIGSDPSVIIADNFESYPAGAITIGEFQNHGWYNVGGVPYTTIDTAEHFADSKSLKMHLATSTAEHMAALILKPDLDVVYIRGYERWDASYNVTTSNHNGFHVQGGTINAGVRVPANGTGGFSFIQQNNQQSIGGELNPGYDHAYVYWPKMNSDFGDHWFPDGNVVPGPSQWLTYPAQYPGFNAMPLHQPNRGQWYCYELMIKLNTIGQSDGEMKWWCDGVVIADFPNLFLRSISTLRIDEIRVQLHALSVPSGNVAIKWYDNVVIATSYIGPIAPL